MECQCSKANFLVGLGLGSLLGVAACYAARSKKARELKGRVFHALHEMQHKVDCLVEAAKEQAEVAAAKAQG